MIQKFNPIDSWPYLLVGLFSGLSLSFMIKQDYVNIFMGIWLICYLLMTLLALGNARSKLMALITTTIPATLASIMIRWPNQLLSASLYVLLFLSVCALTVFNAFYQEKGFVLDYDGLSKTTWNSLFKIIEALFIGSMIGGVTAFILMVSVSLGFDIWSLLIKSPYYFVTAGSLTISISMFLVSQTDELLNNLREPLSHVFKFALPTVLGLLILSFILHLKSHQKFDFGDPSGYIFLTMISIIVINGTSFLSEDKIVCNKTISLLIILSAILPLFALYQLSWDLQSINAIVLCLLLLAACFGYGVMVIINKGQWINKLSKLNTVLTLLAILVTLGLNNFVVGPKIQCHIDSNSKATKIIKI